MAKLLLFNGVLIAVIAAVLIVVKRYAKTERSKRILLMIAPLLTVVCHYSSLLYHALTDGLVLKYLSWNPNLLLPIYPCNVVMWCCVILGFSRKKTGKGASFLVDYVFWFGILSALVGMMANVDFINNPTLRNFDVTKGILAHAFMLFNVLLLPVLGYVKVDLPKNYLHILLSMAMMFVLGCYCNLVFEVVASPETAYEVNSMFILHSPFPEVPYLKYPLICLAAAVFYFALFSACECFAYSKGERWLKRLSASKVK